MDEGSTFMPDPDAVHLGRYQRTLEVALPPLLDTVLDWQRLPHLHAWAFAAVRCLDYSAAGWRIAADLRGGGTSQIELVVDRDARRWQVWVVGGRNAGLAVTAEVSSGTPQGPLLTVDFRHRDVAEGPSVEVLRDCCARFHDLDVAMIRARQRALRRRVDRARDAQRVRVLGPLAALPLPLIFELAGREFVLARLTGPPAVGSPAAAPALVAFPARCPHKQGPLAAGVVDGVSVTCPWHGQRFDLRSGANLSADQTQATCRLGHLPVVEIDAGGSVTVTATH